MPTTSTTPRASLKAILARLAGVPLTSVVWKGEVDTSGQKPPGSLTITDATNASPIVLTVPQGLLVPTGLPMVVSGVTGNLAANGSWSSVTQVDLTHVSLDGSTGSGAYVSGGTLAPATAWRWGMLRASLSARESEGWDQKIRTDNLDGTFAMKLVGRRRAMLALNYVSFDPTGQTIADDVLEAVRSGLFDGAILDALNAAGCAPISRGRVMPIPWPVNGTERSAAHLEIPLAIVATTTGATERGAIGGVNDWINEVKGTGTYTGGAVAETDALDVIA